MCNIVRNNAGSRTGEKIKITSGRSSPGCSERAFDANGNRWIS